MKKKKQSSQLPAHQQPIEVEMTAGDNPKP
jgi:hypothetical protein